MFKRFIATLICVTFSFSNLQYVHAQDFSVNQLPVPGTMVGESAPFSPLALKGLVVNVNKPLEFQFIVDTGKGPQDTALVKTQANQLVKYFLAGLTIPESDLWVNLSPYEKNRMVPEALGQTDLGRDLLAQDYILKQLTASLIYPEKDLGKKFWSRVYAKAQAQFGTTNVPVNTFNKVWILPDQAQVFENKNAAYVTKSTLKVMLDEDYLAKQKHQAIKGASISSQIVREIVIPEITKEVNTGKNFAPLRQIYQALILAKWYKETIQNGLLDALYTNKNKVVGVNLSDPAVKEQIYERYLKAYKKGAFNYIKEDPTPDGQVVPRKYFSGGTFLGNISEVRDYNPADVHGDGAMEALLVNLEPRDAAMIDPTKLLPDFQKAFEAAVPEKTGVNEPALIDAVTDFYNKLGAYLKEIKMSGLFTTEEIKERVYPLLAKADIGVKKSLIRHGYMVNIHDTNRGFAIMVSKIDGLYKISPGRDFVLLDPISSIPDEFKGIDEHTFIIDPQYDFRQLLLPGIKTWAKRIESVANDRNQNFLKRSSNALLERMRNTANRYIRQGGLQELKEDQIVEYLVESTGTRLAIKDVLNMPLDKIIMIDFIQAILQSNSIEEASLLVALFLSETRFGIDILNQGNTFPRFLDSLRLDLRSSDALEKVKATFQKFYNPRLPAFSLEKFEVTEANLAPFAEQVRSTFDMAMSDREVVTTIFNAPNNSAMGAGTEDGAMRMPNRMTVKQFVLFSDAQKLFILRGMSETSILKLWEALMPYQMYLDDRHALEMVQFAAFHLDWRRQNPVNVAIDAAMSGVDKAMKNDVEALKMTEQVQKFWNTINISYVRRATLIGYLAKAHTVPSERGITLVMDGDGMVAWDDMVNTIEFLARSKGIEIRVQKYDPTYWAKAAGVIKIGAGTEDLRELFQAMAKHLEEQIRGFFIRNAASQIVKYYGSPALAQTTIQSTKSKFDASSNLGITLPRREDDQEGVNITSLRKRLGDIIGYTLRMDDIMGASTNWPAITREGVILFPIINVAPESFKKSFRPFLENFITDLLSEIGHRNAAMIVEGNMVKFGYDIRETLPKDIVEKILRIMLDGIQRGDIKVQDAQVDLGRQSETHQVIGFTPPVGGYITTNEEVRSYISIVTHIARKFELRNELGQGNGGGLMALLPQMGSDASLKGIFEQKVIPEINEMYVMVHGHDGAMTAREVRSAINELLDSLNIEREVEVEIKSGPGKGSFIATIIQTNRRSPPEAINSLMILFDMIKDSYFPSTRTRANLTMDTDAYIAHIRITTFQVIDNPDNGRKNAAMRPESAVQRNIDEIEKTLYGTDVESMDGATVDRLKTRRDELLRELEEVRASQGSQSNAATDYTPRLSGASVEHGLVKSEAEWKQMITSGIAAKDQISAEFPILSEPSSQRDGLLLALGIYFGSKDDEIQRLKSSLRIFLESLGQPDSTSLEDKIINRAEQMRQLLNMPETRDNAMVTPGGIDLNQINVKRTGHVINVQFDPAQLGELEQGGFEGFKPVITSMTRISSPFKLLGVNIAEPTKTLAKV